MTEFVLLTTDGLVFLGVGAGLGIAAFLGMILVVILLRRK